MLFCVRDNPDIYSSLEVVSSSLLFCKYTKKREEMQGKDDVFCYYGK